MNNITTDQLSYILERKYKNIIIGQDVIVICSAVGPDNRGRYTSVDDASIAQWNIRNIPQPDEVELQRLWDILKDQYHSDPKRIDSDMYKLVHKDRIKALELPDIVVNLDL